jgi:cytochrome bd ubiquinol oxidase subunit II
VLARWVSIMTIEIVIAGILLISLTFYVLLGGADFGAGVWALLARGASSQRQQHAIAKAIAPIWEANHVWLILVVTILFTAFPKAFALLSTVLHIPLAIMLVGIVLRGCAFTFRTNDVTLRGTRPDAAQRFWEQVFGVSSLLTPMWLGTTIGAIASGRVHAPAGSFIDSFVRPWLAAFPLSVGLLALALFAFLAAVYLVQDTTDILLQETFRLRGLAAGAAVGAAAVLVFILSEDGAPEIREGLAERPWGRTVLILAASAGVAAQGLLWSRRYRPAAFAAGLEAISIVWGWALAQYPYLVEPDLLLQNAAAPPQTLRLLLVLLMAGAVILFPSLYYLYKIFKGHVVSWNSDSTP